MLEYFSKSIQRKFKMMRLLSCSADYIDIKYITDFLNTNERTVQADIKEMSNSEIGNIFDIEIRSGKYKILLKDNASVDSFGHFLMKYNECFLILEHVFFNNHHTVEDLAEIHHCSMATLYRYINLINKGLKGQYNLKFHTNPCRLVGEEIEIRSFYIQYFTERYPASEWPFTDINQGALLTLFKNFTQELGFKLQYSDLIMLKLSLAVSHVRCNQNLYIGQSGPRINLILSRLHQNEIFSNMFMEIFNCNPNPKVFDDNLTYLIKEHFYFNYEEFSSSTQTDEYSAKSYKYLNNMVNEISEKYNLPLINRNDLIYNLHNSAELGIRNINVRPILIDNKYILLKQFQLLFPKFYSDMEIKLTGYIDLMNMDNRDALLNQLLHNVITRWENLYETLYTAQRKIKIRVVSSHDIYHAKLMASLIKTEFYQQVDVTLIDTFILDDMLESNNDIDILVTNFSLLNQDTHIVAVHDIPTSDDFRLIKDVINNIRIAEN